jgi:integrase
VWPTGASALVVAHPATLAHVKGSVRYVRGRWQVLVDCGRDEAGKRLRYRPSFATEDEATAAMVQLMGELLAGTHVDRSALTLGAWLDRWLDDYAALRVTPKTLERYREIVGQHIAPQLGQTRLQQLRGDLLQHYYAERLGRLAPATVRQHHAILHRALGQAVRAGLVAHNAADDAEPPPLRRREVEVLAPAQVTQLLAALADNASIFHVPALLAVTCGLRRGEVCALRWHDLDLKGGRLHVRRSLEQTRAGLRVKETKSASGVRELALPASTAAALRAHRAAQGQHRAAVSAEGLWREHDLVWPDWDGRPCRPDNLSSGFANWTKRTGARYGLPPVGFHVLRHTFASLLAGAGSSPRDIATAIGHADPGFTMRLYAHVLPGASERAAAAIEDAVFGEEVSRPGREAGRLGEGPEHGTKRP